MAMAVLGSGEWVVTARGELATTQETVGAAVGEWARSLSCIPRRSYGPPFFSFAGRLQQPASQPAVKRRLRTPCRGADERLALDFVACAGQQ